MTNMMIEVRITSILYPPHKLTNIQTLVLPIVPKDADTRMNGHRMQYKILYLAIYTNTQQEQREGSGRKCTLRSDGRRIGGMENVKEYQNFTC